MNRNIRSRKGFTLVELTVVLALVSIIVTMALGFLTRYSLDSYELINSRAVVSEITTVRTVINDWVLHIDNQNYTVNAAFNTLSAYHRFGTDEELRFIGHDLVWLSGGTEVKRFHFRALSEATFETYPSDEDPTVNCLIRCRVRFGGTQQDLYFNLFSKSQRSRYSPVDR